MLTSALLDMENFQHFSHIESLVALITDCDAPNDQIGGMFSLTGCEPTIDIVNASHFFEVDSSQLYHNRNVD